MANASRARGLPAFYAGRRVGGGRCAHNSDCPHTKPYHCCCAAKSRSDRCEAGTAGAPEAKGLCANRACARVDAKTHVFDVAAKRWALPLIIHDGAPHMSPDAIRDLKRLAARMRAPDPADRPTFSEALGALEGVG